MCFPTASNNLPYYIQIEGKSDTDTSSQLFFDIGNSYIEKDSFKQKVHKKEMYEKIHNATPYRKNIRTQIRPSRMQW